MQTSIPALPTDPAPRRAPIPRIPGYRIVSQLGRGGMAVVYLAVQESLDRQVAIKIMRPSSTLDEAQAVRFENEARVIAKLEHPGIVGIHEVGRTLDGDLYYVMPYLANGDLGERDYRNDEDGLIALLRVLLDALDYAHARGIVHRDVKAENVLFDNADRPQLADFGIALSRRNGEPRVTSDGFALGSSAHMSPEQARGGTVDGRADLYSLGVLTYELLTGELPFRCADALGLALMHAQDPVPRLPPDKAHWQAFVDRALAKRPEQRHRSAQAMLRALDRVEQRLHPQPFWQAWRANAAWRRPLLLTALGAALVVVPGLVFAPLLAPRPVEATAGLPPPVTEAGSNAALAVTGEDVTAPAIDTKVAAFGAALARARDQLAAGHLLAPAGANAAQTYLDLLTADPASAQAREGLETVLAALSVPIADRARNGDLDGARERFRQAALLAEQARLREAPAFQALALQARQAMQARAETEVRAYERAKALAWLELAREAGAAGERWDALQRRAAALLQPGASTRDRGGPALAVMPRRAGASTLPAPLLMMRDEVSRADYARFAEASGRKPTRCRSRLSPLRLLDRRDWRDPGFAQREADPVVCVSADDAQAYAQWLSTQTGKSYRLPTRAEWRHAWAAAPPAPCTGAACASRRGTAPAGSLAATALGLNDLAGNAAEWTADCAGADAAGAACERRIVAGTSWRDAPGAAEPALRELVPDRGYDDVGFRLVRDP